MKMTVLSAGALIRLKTLLGMYADSSGVGRGYILFCDIAVRTKFAVSAADTAGIKWAARLRLWTSCTFDTGSARYG